MIFSADKLKNKAHELGFNLVGLARGEPSATLEAYLRWIDAGMHADMNYMARPDRIARRQDLRLILPNVQTLVVVGLDYHTGVVAEDILRDASRGRIASYAWGMDYHEIMGPRLELLAQWIRSESQQSLDYRIYVDTGAILERSHAQAAGMGFVGKNTMLIHPRRGSLFFLAEILTTLEFDAYDTAHPTTTCGRCTRCLNACPTDAFPKPYVLDARRCISYHTIENKGWIGHELRPKFGNWVFGCDVCQEVCPFQRFVMPTSEGSFMSVDMNRVAPLLLDLLQMDDVTFAARFHGSPVFRIKRERLVRNACIAAGNWGHQSVLPTIFKLLDDASPLVRGHAAWALWCILGEGAKGVLERMCQRETDDRTKLEVARFWEGENSI